MQARGAVCGAVVAAAAIIATLNLKMIADTMIQLASYPIDARIGSIQAASDGELRARVRGRSALVVGGTKGIGRGIALELTRAGAHVIVVGRSPGEAVVRDMRRLASGTGGGQQLSAVRADLSTAEGCDALVEALATGQQQYDLLFFTVGVWPQWKEPFSADGVERVVAIDLRARHRVLVGLARRGALAPGARLANTLAPTQRFPLLDDAYVRGRLARARTAPPSGLFFDGLLPVAVAADAWLRAVPARLRDAHGVELGTTVGVFPGLVATSLHEQSMPAWVAALAHRLLSFVAISAEQSGRLHIDMLTSPAVAAGLQHATTAADDNTPAVAFVNHLLEARRTHPLAYDGALSGFVWDFLENDCHLPH
eukprot:g5296.t1